MDDLKQYIHEVNDFPQKGINFKDINPIYKCPQAWNQSMIPMETLIKKTDTEYIAGIESRGFIIASALAYKLGLGFIPIRKSNKLPGKVIGINYELEYGKDRLEIQVDSIKESNRIIVIDDLLATGGTAKAAGNLIKEAGAKLIGYGFLIELTKLKGRDLLDNNLIIESSIKY